MTFPLPLRGFRRKPVERPPWTVHSAVRILYTETELHDALERAVQTEQAAIARTQVRLSRYGAHAEPRDATPKETVLPETG